MLNNVSFLKYYPKKSFYHKLNPFTKILSLVLMIMIVILLHTPSEYIIFTLFLIIIIIATNIPMIIYIKQIRGVGIFLLLIFLLNTLLGVPVITSLEMIMKTLLIVITSSILMLTTLPDDINRGIEKILSPLQKILPVHQIALTISLALRFLPTIMEEVNRIFISEANRGLDVRTGSLHEKIDAFRYMLLPTFILTLKRSDDVADIMELRLYGTSKRTSYKDLPTLEYDYLFLLFEVLLMILMIVR